MPTGEHEWLRPHYRHTGELAADAMLAKVLKGDLPGPAPLGYLNRQDRWGHAFVALDEDAAPLVRRSFELLSLRKTSLRRALAEATALGLRSRRGRPLSYSAFQEMATNPFYCGKIRYLGKLYAGNHDPIISEQAFWKIQGSLKERETNRQRLQRL